MEHFKVCPDAMSAVFLVRYGAVKSSVLLDVHDISVNQSDYLIPCKRGPNRTY